MMFSSKPWTRVMPHPGLTVGAAHLPPRNISRKKFEPKYTSASNALKFSVLSKDQP
jgi:hypothetical protein